MVGMSPEGLARCRRLTITSESSQTDFAVRLEVFDPRHGERKVANLVARTPQDVRRIKASLMTKYRVPKENVLEIYEETVGEITEKVPGLPVVESDELTVV